MNEVEISGWSGGWSHKWVWMPVFYKAGPQRITCTQCGAMLSFPVRYKPLFAAKIYEALHTHSADAKLCRGANLKHVRQTIFYHRFTSWEDEANPKTGGRPVCLCKEHSCTKIHETAMIMLCMCEKKVLVPDDYDGSEFVRHEDCGTFNRVVVLRDDFLIWHAASAKEVEKTKNATVFSFSTNYDDDVI